MHPTSSCRRPARVLPLITVAALPAVLAACDAGAEAASAGPVHTLSPVDFRVVGTSDRIAAVLDLEPLPDGTVWVLNSIDPLFVRFDGATGEATSHGRSGGGPDEFGRPAGFVLGGIDGDAWVFDWQRHILVDVSLTNDPRRELVLPPDQLPQGSVDVGMNLLGTVVRTARIGDEVVLPRRSSPPAGDVFSYWLTSWNADLVAWNPASGQVREIVRLRDVLGDPQLELELGTNGLPPFPLWYRLWAVCGEDEVHVFDRAGNQVRAFTPDGAELLPRDLPPVRYESVTPRKFARAAFDLIVVEGMGAVPPNPSFEMSPADSARIIDQALQRLHASPEQLASILPRYVDFRCAPDGTQWLRPLDLDRGGLRGGPTWLRIAPDRAMDEVRFPDDFDPYRFTNDRIWGVQRDELDVASVGWLPVPGRR